jgi:hypothetical protein
MLTGVQIELSLLLLLQSDSIISIALALGFSLFLFINCVLCLSKCREEPAKEPPPTRPEREFGIRFPRKPRAQKPIPGVAYSITRTEVESPSEVKILRGGEFVGNKMRFKVKILNESEFTITDVTVFLISYPRRALKLVEGDDDILFVKIEPKGFRSPQFEFLPTQDCVRGEIVAGASYVDMRGKAHTLTAKPFIIRAVCDLLNPSTISHSEFKSRIEELECGEIQIKVEDWTPEEMFEKTIMILEDANFFKVASDSSVKEGMFEGTVTGWAKGKYTGNQIAVEITITGLSNTKGASCHIRVSGEDDAMLLPAIDDLRERLSAWLCPMCGSALGVDIVEDLREGKVVACPFCDVSIGR